MSNTPPPGQGCQADFLDVDLMRCLIFTYVYCAEENVQRIYIKMYSKWENGMKKTFFAYNLLNYILKSAQYQNISLLLHDFKTTIFINSPAIATGKQECLATKWPLPHMQDFCKMVIKYDSLCP